MNFITELFMFDDYNAILTVVNLLLKKRHYIFCLAIEEEISVEFTAKLLIQ